ncbi:MAG TPA: biopolymer transporter Tol [Opitutaceae bacterium]
MKRLLLCLALALAPAAFAAAPSFGDLTVNGTNSVSVLITGSDPSLDALARRAFGSHGRYYVAAPGEGYRYELRFNPAGPGQVRVDILPRFGSPLASEVASAPTTREALLKAADLAVERTNGKGLRGFFSSKLVFIGERTGHKEVYTSDLFFGSVRQITHDRAIAMSPRWSPDGGRILYTSYYRSGFPDIFLIDLDGYQRTVFESFKGTNSGARFNENGTQVAMVLSGEGQTEIYVADGQGHRVSRRTHSDTAKASPCFSPDGSRIVFAMEPGPQLYVIPAAGGYPRRVSPSGFSRYCAEPDWSRANPDKIAFTMQGGGYQIAVLSLSSGTAQQVSRAPFDGIEPSWLPDGRHLVYTARDRTTSALCILDTETGKSTAISRGFGPAFQASVWSR